MSKRYGRNQKRRHREERTNLLEQLACLTDSCAQSRDAVQALQRELSVWKPRLIVAEDCPSGDIATTVRLSPHVLRFARNRDAVLEQVALQIVEDLRAWVDQKRRF